MKVSSYSQREYERKIQHLEDKLKKAKEKNSNYSKEMGYLKKRVRGLIESRDNWKSKNRCKAKNIKNLKNSLRRPDRLKRHHYSFMVVALCVQFRIHAGCTYRGIKKILLVLQSCSLLNIPKIPCANTIENWVSKMGYHKLENQVIDWSQKEVCLIVDERVTKGNDRVLLMLYTPLQKEKEESLRYTDVRVCYIGSSNKWNGESIKTEITRIVADTGMQIQLFLSDEDNKLKKAARLLGYPYLPDINHAVASCLRNVFEKDTDYLELRKQIVLYQRKSSCHSLSYLHPPKQRSKARFMNQKQIVRWASAILDNYKRLNKDEQVFFKALFKHKSTLKVLGNCIKVGEQLALLLKTKGLSKVSLSKAKQLIDQLECKEKRMLGFISRLKKYIQKYEAHLKEHKGVFNVCSDIIESMFGQHKRMEATNTMVGLTQLDLELSLHCLEEKEINRLIKVGLESVFMTDIAKWKKEYSADNQMNKRKKFFKK